MARLRSHAKRVDHCILNPPPFDVARAESLIAKIFVAIGRRPPLRVQWHGGPSQLPSQPKPSPHFLRLVSIAAHTRDVVPSVARVVEQLIWTHSVGGNIVMLTPLVQFRRRRRRAHLRPLLDPGLRGTRGMMLGIVLPAEIGATSASLVGRLCVELVEAGVFGFWALTGRQALAIRRPLVHTEVVPLPWRDPGGARDRHVLHAVGKPAIEWPNGEQIFLWHGVVVPREIALDPDRITPELIDRTTNMALRRVMMEHLTAERYIRDGRAVLVDGPEGQLAPGAARLWGKPMWDAPPLVMLELCNSTPEPDGSHAIYWLRVPPEMRSADEAVAWSFRMESGEYHPDVET